MFPILQVGPLALQTPGLILLLGVWLGLSFSERAAARFGVDPNRLYSLVLTALAAGIIGARLGYVARYPDVFLDSLVSVVSINISLLDAPTGVGIGLIAAWVYGQRKRMPLWPTLDALTPGLAVFAVAFAISQLASGAAFGAPTSLPWGIELWGARRHPTQIYAALFAAATLWVIRPGRTSALLAAPGARFLIFLALTAGARLFLEAFHGDSVTLSNGIRTAQILAWIGLALSLWGLGKIKIPDST